VLFTVVFGRLFCGWVCPQTIFMEMVFRKIEYWIHGGSISSIFKTIKYGVAAKGMIAWQSQFSPSQMQKIASYVKSMQGSNPPGAKDPQGEIYVEEVITEDPDSTQSDTTTIVVGIEEE